MKTKKKKNWGRDSRGYVYIQIWIPSTNTSRLYFHANENIMGQYLWIMMYRTVLYFTFLLFQCLVIESGFSLSRVFSCFVLSHCRFVHTHTHSKFIFISISWYREDAFIGQVPRVSRRQPLVFSSSSIQGKQDENSRVAFTLEIEKYWRTEKKPFFNDFFSNQRSISLKMLQLFSPRWKRKDDVPGNI